MDRVLSACIKTDSSKTCFVSLSEDLAEALGRRIQGQAFALHLQWPSAGAFTSWSGEVIHTRKDDSFTGSSSVIQLGRKFAVSLGLEEGDQVLVQPVTSILSCNRLCVDPISADDWEILELHAGYIENELLNQVRVVFLGQLLPIWIEKTTCVIVKIVGLEPEASCLRLDEFTEVVVSPMTRNFASTKLDQQSLLSSAKSATPPSSGTSQRIHQNDTKSNFFHHSNAISGNSQSLSSRCSVFEHGGQSSAVDKSFFSRLSGYFSSFLEKSSDQDYKIGRHDLTSTSLAQSGDKSAQDMNKTASRGKLVTKDFEDIDIDLNLRVQPETKLNCHVSYSLREAGFSKTSAIYYYSQQPSTVFVDFASLPPPVFMSCSQSFRTFPPPDGKVVKIVEIKRLASPKERAASQVSNTANRREGVDTRQEKTAADADDVSIRSAPDSSPAKNVTSCWIVRMVMISSKNSDLINQRSNEVAMENSVVPGHIALSKELLHVLGAGDMSIVKLQGISHGPLEIKGIILHPFGDTVHKLDDVTADTAIEAFQDWLRLVSSKEFPLVLCSGMLVSCGTSQGDHIQFTVTVLSQQQSSKVADVLQYYYLTPETVQTVTVVLGAPTSSLQGPDEGFNPRENHTPNLKNSIGDLGGVTDNFGKCLDHALSCLSQRQIIAQLGGNITTGLCRGALLICGSGSGAGIGCGKTSLAHAVCCKLQQWPVFAHVNIVDCIPFRGKRVDVIQKNWQQIFAEAAWHQPSVILFDDLDQVISAPSALQEFGGESLYKYRLASVFKDLINKEIISNSKVVVIATARSCDSLHPLLLTSRGCHIFQCCVELHPPDAHQREAILCAMINKKLNRQTSDGLELGSLMKKTEGFSPKDLCSLVDCALHMAAIREINVSGGSGVCSNITMEDFKEALEGFTPVSLRGVSLHTAGELGWSDVGGLVKVKEALMETLLWPAKYSWLFKKSPLGMRSGLLLYGPPGTGKTLLAGVVAKECGLNFISIKGPELLSKYIGASEQAVRDMFTRAESAKPCILFFDEFDSLAPRRGHDNTGVTDRVVNQLLTQLDGVEGLDGVYVLAATSRPDLIDPALLRPGRLDKCLYCGIPDKSERLEILQALSKLLLLAVDTNLRVISDSCDNFTGADFKALLYNAQLTAIHRTTSNSRLYKGALAGSEKEDQDKNSKGLEQENLVYIPSLAEGAKDLSTDVLTKLQSDVEAIQENLCETNRLMTGQKFTRRNDSSSVQVSSGVQISQSDLLQAASSMGPSVSDSERIRYQTIYDTFIKSKGGEFNHSNPGQGKATLA